MESSETDSDGDDLRCYIKREDGTFVEVASERRMFRSKLNSMEFFRERDDDRMERVDPKEAVDSINACLSVVKARLSLSNASIKRADCNFQDCSESSAGRFHRKRSRREDRFERNDSPIILFDGPRSKKRNHSSLSNALVNFSVSSEAPDSDESSVIFEDANREKSPNKSSIDTEHINNQHTKVLSVNPSRVNLIRKWLARNDDFYPREDRKRRLVTLFSTNRNFFIRVLYAFNPIVRIPYLFSVIDQYSKNDRSSNNKKEEFLHTLKLMKGPYRLKQDSPSSTKRDSHNFEINGNGGETSSKGSPDLLYFPNNQTVKKDPYINSPNGDREGKLINDFSIALKNNLLKCSANFQKRSEDFDIAKKPWVKKNTSPYFRSDNNLISSEKGILRNYTMDEDKIILKWVLKNSNVYLVNGNRIWQDLEEKKAFPTARTWHSLRNRFLRVIMYNLRDYGLDADDEMRIKIGAQKGCIVRNKSTNNRLITNKKTKLTRVEGKENAKTPTKRVDVEVKVKKVNNSPDLFDDDVGNYNHYSDSDIIEDNSFQVSYKHKKEIINKRQLFSNRTFIKNESSSK